MRKLFPADKNTILRTVQRQEESKLLAEMIGRAKLLYLEKYNPLGLVDRTVSYIQSNSEYPLEYFSDWYEQLAGVYRFKYDDAQLCLEFDGKTQEERYADEWAVFFLNWSEQQLRQDSFLQSVLQAAVFDVSGHSRTMAVHRLKSAVTLEYDLAVFKKRLLAPGEIKKAVSKKKAKTAKKSGRRNLLL